MKMKIAASSIFLAVKETRNDDEDKTKKEQENDSDDEERKRAIKEIAQAAGSDNKLRFRTMQPNLAKDFPLYF